MHRKKAPARLQNKQVKREEKEGKKREVKTIYQITSGGVLTG
jgi:hypothetical protein